MAEQFVPDGADGGFTPVDATEVTEQDVDEAVRSWDRTVDPKYRGMLDAEPVE